MEYTRESLWRRILFRFHLKFQFIQPVEWANASVPRHKSAPHEILIRILLRACISLFRIEAFLSRSSCHWVVFLFHFTLWTFTNSCRMWGAQDLSRSKNIHICQLQLQLNASTTAKMRLRDILTKNKEIVHIYLVIITERIQTKQQLKYCAHACAYYSVKMKK